ncbi:hypothetical protein BC833DRAFT_579923 [Globomyces pollinis-pini]|nr:hypothetical protein BC833DRAFT_579923 [Globomyces pollinis-pini]
MSSIDQLRLKQIESLAVFDPKQVGQSYYQIVCHLPSQVLHIFIHLPSHFPEVKPSIEVKPAINHPWFKNGVLANDRIIKWSLHSSLGKVIEELLLEFSMNPPVINVMTSNQYSKPVEQSIPSPTTLPTQELEFIGLDTKTNQELEDLLLDDNAFAEYFYSLDQVKPNKEMQDSLLEKNNEIAKTNLNREDEIKDLQTRIKALQEINVKHREQLDDLLQEQQKELVRFGSEYITEQLRQMVATSEDMTELSATSYLEGKLTEDEFIKAFKESRKLFHARSFKLEKLTQ